MSQLVADLYDRIEYLEEANRQLREQMLAPDASVPPALKLQPGQRKLLHALLSRDFVSRYSAALVVSPSEDQAASDSTVKVRVSRLRARLRDLKAPPCCDILCVWGEGYRLADRKAAEQWVQGFAERNAQCES